MGFIGIALSIYGSTRTWLIAPRIVPVMASDISNSFGVFQYYAFIFRPYSQNIESSIKINKEHLALSQ
jgi:hypothetical protein